MATTATESPDQATPVAVAHGVPQAKSLRIHYLDNLRAIAMLLGVFLHAALAYANPAQSIWLATDTKSSVSIDASIWFIHLFRMGLFFLISGYLAAMTVQRKGIRIFLRNRALRVLLTMVLFFPLLLVLMTAAIIFAISYLQNPQGLMGLIAAASKDVAAQSSSSSPITTMHLWFLYYLMFFAVLSAIFSKFRWIKFDWLFDRPGFMVCVPLLLAFPVYYAGIPLPAPESFTPTWWPFAFYGVFYWAGWQLKGREGFLDQLNPLVWYLVALSICLFIPYYLCMPTLDLSLLISAGVQEKGWSYVVAAVLTGYLSTLLTIVALLIGRRFLEHRSPILGLIADASFWIYLIHLPLVIFLQTIMVPFDWSVWIKLSIVVSGTLSFCMATYLVFVRYTPVGWLLHGKRSFP